MTAPYLPYSQQNYADWKARLERDSQIGGLLRQAKMAAGLEEQPSGQMPPMLQAPPQEQAQPQMPPQVPPAMQAPEPTPEELHAHQKGIRGGLLHLLGADRQAPEVAALLSPEERERIQPGVLGTLWHAVAEGKGPQAVQQERALNIVGLRDAKARREQRERILKAFPMPSDPAEMASWSETVARVVAAAPVPDPEWSKDLTTTAAQLEPPSRAPVTETFGNPIAMMYNGQERMVQVGNQGTVRPVEGASPMPKSDTAEPVNIVKTVVNGKPMIEGIRRDGTQAWIRPDREEEARAATTAREKREAELRGVADSMSDIQNAIASVTANPTALGLKNLLPTVVRQRMPGRDHDRDAETLGLLEYVVGRIRHDRFGGALTQLEASKSARIFSEPSSPPEVVLAQLQVLANAVERKQRALTEAQDRSPAPQDGETVTINGRQFVIPRRTP